MGFKYGPGPAGAPIGTLTTFDDPADSLADITTPYFLERTGTTGGGVKTALHVQHRSAFANNQIAIAILGDSINTGSNDNSGGAHVPGVIGRSEDTIAGAMSLWGVEGKVVSKSTFNNHYPHMGIYQRNVAIALGAGSVSVYGGFPEITEVDGSTPDNTGTVVMYDATLLGTGGDPTKRFALKGSSTHKIETGGDITAYGTASEIKVEATLGGRKVSLTHDDVKGSITQSEVNQDLGLYSGRFLIYEQGSGFVARTNGTDLGINGFRWRPWVTESNMAQQTEPATPIAGTNVFYAKSDGMYFKNPAAVENKLFIDGESLFIVAANATDTLTTLRAHPSQVSNLFECQGSGGSSDIDFAIGDAGQIKVIADKTTDVAPNDDTTLKKITLQKLAIAPTNAAYIAFANNPGSDTFYLVLEEG